VKGIKVSRPHALCPTPITPQESILKQHRMPPWLRSLNGLIIHIVCSRSEQATIIWWAPASQRKMFFSDRCQDPIHPLSVHFIPLYVDLMTRRVLTVRLAIVVPHDVTKGSNSIGAAKSCTEMLASFSIIRCHRGSISGSAR
jgi:hypothetical protein